MHVHRPSRRIALFATFALVACGREAPQPVNPGLVPGTHVYTATDRVDLPYDVAGDGDTTVVLVHCWMCERTFWDAQLPVLQERYRVIAVDLPGHGEAGDDRTTWSIAGFGADIAGLLEHLDLTDVVLVGHSMGGPVSLAAAALAGDRVKGVVAVDTLHDADFDFDQPMVAEMVGAFQADFRGVCTNFVEQMFVEEGIDDLIARVRRVGCEESNAEAGKALMADYATLDMPALFANAGVPIRAINAATPNPTRVENNRKYSDFDVVLMEDVGHYLHMTRPAEFNVLLLRTLDELEPAPGD